jgi:hypothetical protein
MRNYRLFSKQIVFLFTAKETGSSFSRSAGDSELKEHTVMPIVFTRVYPKYSGLVL